MRRGAVLAAVLLVLLFSSGCASPPATAPESSAPSAPAPTAVASPYLFLWPFDDPAEATGRTDLPGWHTDASATALTFTRAFLGFTDIDRITGAEVDGDEAWVGVGYADPLGQARTAATIHLLRIDPPGVWEVVGTRDTSLTLDGPRYGSTVGPRIDAAGTVTGVDECIRLQVRQHPNPAVLGEFSCEMAGGQPGDWSAQVMTRGLQPGVATVVASSGGHIATVEKFAITGVRT